MSTAVGDQACSVVSFHEIESLKTHSARVEEAGVFIQISNKAQVKEHCAYTETA